MILVIGGLAAGKRSYVRSLGFADSDISRDLESSAPVVIDAQELVRCGGEAGDVQGLADRIAQSKQVAVCVEVGGGIVPVDADERMWRERAGALARALSERAEAVVRVVCGIPTALKGELPRGASAAKPSGSVQVVIMRHGSTTANEARTYAGSIDVALTERGEAQAREAGTCESVERVYVSSYQRARRTAELCFPNAVQEVVDDLREMDFGDFEGRSAADMEHDEAYRAWVESNCVDRCPNGECRAELTERVCAALDRIVREAVERGDERVVVIGHGGTIMGAMNGLATDKRPYFEWQVGNCEGYCADAVLVDDGLRLERPRRFADLSFLEKRAPKPGSSFFQNRSCEYFPCHEGVPDDEFNCLYCYCPLYALGPDCGGNFTYTERGRKNCAGCAMPHRGEDGAKLVADHYEQLADLARASAR